MAEQILETRRADVETLAERLEATMRLQDESYGALLGLLERKRSAIARADITAIGELCRLENDVLQRIGDQEKARLEIVGALTEVLDPSSPKPLSANAIAEQLGGEAGDRLLAIAALVRKKVERLRRLSAILRDAAETLGGHVAGILQIMHSALSQARVYGRKGHIASGAVIRSTLDLKS